jgi:hypothetical protein
MEHAVALTYVPIFYREDGDCTLLREAGTCLP